jgi:hypothetical protein
MSLLLSRYRKPLLVIGTSLSLIALALAHAYVARRGPAYVGWPLFLDHLFDLAAVAALLAVSTAVGHRVLKWLGLGEGHPLEVLIFSTAVGAGVAATFYLFLGAAQVLRPTTLWLLTAVLAAAAGRELVTLPRLLARALSALRPGPNDRAFAVFGVAVLMSALLFIAIQAIAPPTDWDALMYHLRIPQGYLQEGRIYLPADNLHASLIGLSHMLYLPLLSIGSASGPAILNAGLAGLLALALLAFCRRLLADDAGYLSLALLWSTTTILLVAITPRVDVALALYLFAAQYALILAVSGSKAPRRHYFLAALLLGFAVGIKLSALAYILALSPLVLWFAISRGDGPAGAARALLFFGLAVAVAAAPVLLKNWALFGAPLYPFLAKPMLQPWLAPLFGGTGWPAFIDPDISQLIWGLRAKFNLWDAFFAPGRLTIEAEGAFYYLSPAFLLLPLWLLHLKNRTLNWLVVPPLIYLGVVLTIFPSPNLRYLIPAAAPLTIAVAYLALAVSKRLLSPPAVRILLVSLGAIALFPSARATYVWLTRTRSIDYFVGKVSAEGYIASRIGAAYVETVRWANENLREGDKILMLFDARGYYFEPEVIQDNNSTNWPLLAAAPGLDDCLHPLGVTHVLLGLGALNYYAAAGLDPERIRWRDFQAFARRCLRPVLDTGALVLFEVVPDGPAAGGPAPGRGEGSGGKR